MFRIPNRWKASPGIPSQLSYEVSTGVGSEATRPNRLEHRAKAMVWQGKRPAHRLEHDSMRL